MVDQDLSRAGLRNFLRDQPFPEEWPFSDKDFSRTDESSDVEFYTNPRFVFHIDEGAVRALTEYYARVLLPWQGRARVLDICSSWVSHYPEGFRGERISGLGMNEEELKKNPILTDYVVRDLNEEPKLPYSDNEFDVVTNCVSVDYLTRPLEVFQEIRRVLRPSGIAIMSFSNRCFPSKAINLWLNTSDWEHMQLVACYFHYATGFAPAQGFQLKSHPLNLQDPMWVVAAQKL